MPGPDPETKQFTEIQCTDLASKEEFTSLQTMYMHPVVLKVEGAEKAFSCTEVLNGEEKELPADSVVISVGFRPLPSMAEELKNMGIAVCEIGDGQKVGNVLTSIWSAFDAAKEI